MADQSNRCRVVLCSAVLALAGLVLAKPAAAAGGALLLVDADSGRVLHAENATYPWYPASLTKLMTAYVTLQAVKEKRIALDSLLTVSAEAAAQQPSKMGFPEGTQLTVDNALKMIMVKSANDVSVTLAEGVSGSVANFVHEMNAAAHRLGMTQTNYANPNGLPAANQVTSARDQALLARALLHEFPEHAYYWQIPAIRLGKRVMRNYNSLIDRYPGADGMKTGFICSSGFNLVASASRNGRRLIAVVLGAPSAPVRAQRAAQLLESGFTHTGTLSWLAGSFGQLDSLRPIAAAPPDLYDQTCGPNRRRPAAESDEEEGTAAATASGDEIDGGTLTLRTAYARTGPLLGPRLQSSPPVVVFAGPSIGVGAAAVPARAGAGARTAALPAATDAAPARADGLPLPRTRPQAGAAKPASGKVAGKAAAKKSAKAKPKKQAQPAANAATQRAGAPQ